VVSHEIGQWCVYPNFEEITKYTGVLKPKNFDIFHDFLRESGMGDQARDFLMASGKLQALCYKEEIESALRTKGFGGFQLLDLHDFPGQGTALVGVLDPFWDSKPYITPEAFNRFCAETVPLARMEKRVWTSDETFTADLEISHFGPAPLANRLVTWEIKDEKDRLLGFGQWNKDVETGTLTRIGRIEQPLSEAAKPAKCVLRARVQGTPFENTWSFWVYPPAAGEEATRSDPRIVGEWDQAALSRLQSGEALWLMADPRTVRTDVKLGFSSIFWNTAWTRGQAPHTLGILCEPTHPALKHFPTEYHSNWQWWDLVSRAATLELDDLPAGLQPIVQVVPDWFNPKRLGLVFEAKVGKGKVLVTSMDLKNDLKNRPVARQMRASLLRYIDSSAFRPDTEVAPEQLDNLFKPISRLRKLGAVARADSQEPGYEAALVIDGDPATMWHTSWGDRETPYPHFLEIRVNAEQAIAGLTVLPRSDMTNGRIADYRVTVDGKEVARGTWPNNAKIKKIMFKQPLAGRVIKLEALSEVQGRNWASVAEIDILFKQQ
jgi:hypothetical protein